jgi:hypothetical protein
MHSSGNEDVADDVGTGSRGNDGDINIKSRETDKGEGDDAAVVGALKSERTTTTTTPTTPVTYSREQSKNPIKLLHAVTHDSPSRADQGAPVALLRAVSRDVLKGEAAASAESADSATTATNQRSSTPLNTKLSAPSSTSGTTLTRTSSASARSAVGKGIGKGIGKGGDGKMTSTSSQGAYRNPLSTTALHVACGTYRRFRSLLHVLLVGFILAKSAAPIKVSVLPCCATEWNRVRLCKGALSVTVSTLPLLGLPSVLLDECCLTLSFCVQYSFRCRLLEF